MERRAISVQEHAAVDPVREAYDRSAAFYDLATQDDDYDRWVGLYADLLREHGTPGHRLVDLGCGTGKASLRLAAYGFQVTGVDLSPEMLRVARAKPGAARVRLVTGDLRQLPGGLGPFDVAVTFGEPLNYLENENELLATFSGVARLLTPGGLFVFDLNTAGFYRNIAIARDVTEQEEMLVIHRGGAAPHKPGGADLHVDHFQLDGALADGATRWTRTSVTYSWAYFAPRSVQRLLDSAGLTQIAEYGLDRNGLHPVSNESTDRKRLVVARSQ